TALGGHGETHEPMRMGQAPGTHWYHAHKHGSTAINVANGMTGAFIIEGNEYDGALDTFYGAGWTRSEHAHVMVINQIGVTPNLMRGAASQIDKGPDFSVNGRLRPAVSMRPGEVQMWRIVNASGRAGVYFTGPPAGFEWKQLAQDGVQFQNENYDKSRNKKFLMAAGNRVDLLVKAPSTPCTNSQGCTYPVMVQNAVDMTDLTGASVITLLSVKVSGEVVGADSKLGKFISPAPTPPPFLNDIQDSEVTGTKVMRFASLPPGAPKPPGSPRTQHTIDGQQFDGEVGAVVLLNKVEEWKVLNESYGPLISHPFHIHINPFQVTEVFSPNDTIPDPKKPGQTLPLYVFDPKAKVSANQCFIDPLDPNTWKPFDAKTGKPCGTPAPKTNRVWWDVFPIPSGVKAKDANGNPINVTVIDPKTGKPVIDPKTKKPEQVQVQVPGYFKMRSRFVDYSGFYVIHCHILAHEDRGMMTIVEVAPARTPYSHH
ncbi:MAG: multicopper oxidase domain-containing protein, partial [Acidobacteria bacterium]|nr:multicopper oxidase domain-containing protein [Acidobacteriota bacterium]